MELLQQLLASIPGQDIAFNSGCHNLSKHNKFVSSSGKYQNT